MVCHGIPDSRKLQSGDIVNLDITVYYKGYHGDLNETFFVGKVSDEDVRLVECAYESLRYAISKRRIRRFLPSSEAEHARPRHRRSDQRCGGQVRLLRRSQLLRAWNRKDVPLQPHDSALSP